jgi:hypothetical protein
VFGAASQFAERRFSGVISLTTESKALGCSISLQALTSAQGVIWETSGAATGSQPVEGFDQEAKAEQGELKCAAERLGDIG